LIYKDKTGSLKMFGQSVCCNKVKNYDFALKTYWKNPL